MLLKFKDPAMISPDSFKNPVPVKESVVKDRNLGLILVPIFSIDLYFHGATSASLLEIHEAMQHWIGANFGPSVAFSSAQSYFK